MSADNKNLVVDRQTNGVPPIRMKIDDDATTVFRFDGLGIRRGFIEAGDGIVKRVLRNHEDAVA
ncbi:hypothetical protein D3C72_701650 [compost metagenome]